MEHISKDDLLTKKDVRYCETLSNIFVTVILLFLPLFFNNTFYENIETAKWRLFSSVSAAYIIAIVLGLLVICSSKKLRSSRFIPNKQKLTRDQVLLLVFFTTSCFSALLSDYGKDCIMGQSRYEGLLSLFFYLSIYICLSFWGEYTENYFYYISVVSVIIGIIALAQLCGSTFLYPDGYGYYNSQFLSTIGNIDFLSGVISCFLPVAMCSYILLNIKARYIFLSAVFLLSFTQFAINVDTGKLSLICSFAIVLPFLIDTKKNLYRTVQIIGLLLFSLGLCKSFNFPGSVIEDFDLSFNPGALAIFAIILGIILFALGLVLEKKCNKVIKKGKKTEIIEDNFKREAFVIRKYSYLSILIAGLVAITLLFFYSGSNVLLHEIHELMHLRLSDEAGSGRGIVYKDCIKIISENPWFGNGPGTFKETYDLYKTGDILFDIAHCDLLQIAVCQGIVSLAIYILFIVEIYLQAFKNTSKFQPTIIFIASITGYLIYSFLNCSTVMVSPYFWIIAGVLSKTIRQITK